MDRREWQVRQEFVEIVGYVYSQATTTSFNIIYKS